MKVLHLIESSEPGGAEAIVVSLCEALRHKGDECVVGVLQPGWLQEKLVGERFDVHLFRNSKRYDFSYLRDIYRFIKANQVNLVHCHEFAMNAYGTVAGWLAGVPVVTTVHGKNYYWERWRRRMSYRMVSTLSKMVAVSRDIKSYLIESVGVRECNVITIHNGIECGKFIANKAPRLNGQVREELRIPPNNRVIASVGMLAPVKDYATLIKAFRIILMSLPNATLVIAGDGPLRVELENQARHLGISDRVILCGHREDIPWLLGAVDVYVCSSLSEGISLSILEAMAAGIPVVATEVGGNAEVVVDEQTGFLVPAGAETLLAARILRLLKDDVEAEHFGQSGRQRVLREFSRESMVCAYNSLYHDLLTARSDPKCVA